ncbi:MAG: hypothetical protein HUJ52_03295, partial [Malacoplasma sp.]|nr:hypothetical protein [Malacoplasma sp.]
MLDKKLKLNKFSDEVEQDGEEIKPKDKSAKTGSTRPKKTFSDHWRWLKWVIILLVIGLIIFLIVWFSIDHNRKVTVAGDGISVSDNRVSLTVRDGSGTKTLTSDRNDLHANYLVVGGDTTIYKFYLKGTDWGTVEFSGSKNTSTMEIPIAEQEQPVVATVWTYTLDNWTKMFAYYADTYYVQQKGSEDWKAAQGSDYETADTLNTVTLSKASVPSGTNVGLILLQLLPTLLILALF